jgi:hypothetical protein
MMHEDDTFRSSKHELIEPTLTTLTREYGYLGYTPKSLESIREALIMNLHMINREP